MHMPRKKGSKNRVKGFKSVEYQGLLCNQIGRLCEDLKEKGILTDEDFV